MISRWFMRWHTSCISLVRMRRTYQSLPGRAKWELIFALLLVCAIGLVLAIPSPRPAQAAARLGPLLFQLVESDFSHPVYGTAASILQLSRVPGDFLGFGGYDEFSTYSRLPHGHVRLVKITRYAGQALKLAGAQFLLRSHELPGLERTVYLSEPFWEREFARDASIVGTVLTLAGQRCRVDGIIKPAKSGFLVETDAWFPLTSSEIESESLTLRVFGALNAEIRWNEAQKQFDRMFQRVFGGWAAGIDLPRLVPIERSLQFSPTIEVTHAAESPPFQLLTGEEDEPG